MSPCFLIFGFGYTAKVLAPQLVSQGFRVLATSRTPDEQQANALVQIIDFNDPNMEDYLSLSTHMLISTPPSSTLGDPVLNQYGDLIKKASHLQWLGYLSSTGVYGDHQGQWVNEDSPCSASSSTGNARLQAEQAWLKFAQENIHPLHVFRLSGIYGPGRNVIERLLQGKKSSIFKEEQVFCRIHVEDIVATLLASIQYPNPLCIYNVSDDEPAPPHIVDQYGCTLLQRPPLPLIPFAEAPLSPMEKEFYSNNRRVCNLKIKNELKVILKYPTYREGLNQIWNKRNA